MSTYGILIRFGELSLIEFPDGYTTVVTLPDDSPADGASLIAEADWIALADEYGSEEALMKALGVEKDLRQEGEWRYVSETVAEDKLGEY